MAKRNTGQVMKYDRAARTKNVTVWYGVVWCGVVWCGVVWCGVVWCGVLWCGVVWCGVVRFIKHADSYS